MLRQVFLGNSNDHSTSSARKNAILLFASEAAAMIERGETKLVSRTAFRRLILSFSRLASSRVSLSSTSAPLSWFLILKSTSRGYELISSPCGWGFSLYVSRNVTEQTAYPSSRSRLHAISVRIVGFRNRTHEWSYEKAVRSIIERWFNGRARRTWPIVNKLRHYRSHAILFRGIVPRVMDGCNGTQADQL